MTTEERRRHRRQVARLAVRIRLNSIDELVEEYARDISLSGMSLRTNQPIAEGERIYLEFRLLDSAPVIAVFADVRWCRSDGNVHLVGVEFVDLDDAGRNFLQEVLVYIEERRLHRRIKANRTVEIRTPSMAAFAQVYAQDISAGGMQIVVDQPLEEGHELNVRFALESGRELFEAPGIVRWCEPRDQGFAVGLEFKSLDANSKKLLTELLRRQNAAHR